jgi:small subunit ribosomal protein S17
MAEENQEDLTPAPEVAAATETATTGGAPANVAGSKAEASTKGTASGRGNRAQKVGIVASDKMQKTIVVRVDRLVKHPKYRRYVRRTSKFMAHDEVGATIGDKVRIVETRPLSARKRWRVVEIVQKAAK